MKNKNLILPELKNYLEGDLKKNRAKKSSEYLKNELNYFRAEKSTQKRPENYLS